jgi:hypothetical protein
MVPLLGTVSDPKLQEQIRDAQLQRTQELGGPVRGQATFLYAYMDLPGDLP